MDQLGEYSTGGITIGHGRRTGTVTIPAQLSASVTDTAIQAFLQRQINAGVLPKTTGMTMRTARSATSAPGRRSRSVQLEWSNKSRNLSLVTVDLFRATHCV
jgi:hypothetical protein